MPKKNHLLILFLIGMLLFVAVIPLPSSDQADTSAESESVSTAGVTGTSMGEYETYLEKPGSHKAHDKYQHGIKIEGQGHKQHQHSAKAVYGYPGAYEKAPVDQLFIYYGYVAGFKYPPEEAEHVKQ